jgi:hypothetical protein
MQSVGQILFIYAWNVTGSDRMNAFETILHIEKLAVLMNIMLGREKQLVLLKFGLPLCSFMLLPHFSIYCGYRAFTIASCAKG